MTSDNTQVHEFKVGDYVKLANGIIVIIISFSIHDTDYDYIRGVAINALPFEQLDYIASPNAVTPLSLDEPILQYIRKQRCQQLETCVGELAYPYIKHMWPTLSNKSKVIFTDYTEVVIPKEQHISIFDVSPIRTNYERVTIKLNAFAFRKKDTPFVDRVYLGYNAEVDAIAIRREPSSD